VSPVDALLWVLVGVAGTLGAVITYLAGSLVRAVRRAALAREVAAAAARHPAGKRCAHGRLWTVPCTPCNRDPNFPGAGE